MAHRIGPLLVFALAACGPGGGSGGDGSPDARPDGGGPDGDLDADADGGGDADAEPACGPAEVVAAIDLERIRETVAALTALPERSTRARQEEAADLLAARLDAAGVPFVEVSYELSGESYRNLEVTLPGTDLAAEIYAAGAHYDSTSSMPGDAPGADDNAAGAAAVVEIARAMAGCSLRRTVRLLLFSNEERGALGSAAYVRGAAARGDDIRGFLNLDMIAYGPEDEDLDVATLPEHGALAEAVAAACRSWVGLPVQTVIDDACG